MADSNSDWKEPDALIFAALLAALLIVVGATVIPEYVRARALAPEDPCIVNLREIDGAKQRWAFETKAASGAVPTWENIRPYLGRKATNALPVCPQGGVYTIGALTNAPTCSFKGHALQ